MRGTPIRGLVVVAALVATFMAALDYYQPITFHAETEKSGGYWKERTSVFHIPYDTIPAQLPGPMDLWAGAEAKEITLSLPFRSPVSMAISFLETHDSAPPVLHISLDGHFVAKVQTKRGTGLPTEQWRKKGTRSKIRLPLGGSATRNGGSVVSLRNIQGSWVGIEKITLFPPFPVAKTTAALLLWALFSGLILRCDDSCHSFDRRKTLGATLGTLILFVTAVGTFMDRPLLSQTARFGGDTWEYQSMAVNFARGHGINRFGACEPFETYRFSAASVKLNAANLDSFMQACQNKESVDTLRTPGYPTALGLFYALYGVSPLLAKKAQLLLVIAVACMTSLLGLIYWGWRGYALGLAAGWLFLAEWGVQLSSNILTEALTCFIAAVTLLAYAWYEWRPSTKRGLLFGVILGMNPLVKGSLIFAPPLFILLLATPIFKKSGWRTLKSYALLLPVIIGVLIPTAPWSLYASAHAERFVLFSTQTKSILLDNNNEFALDGDWHPEGTQSPGVFYQREDIRELPTLKKVALFYLNHTEMIPTIFFNKFNRGFKDFPWFRAFLIATLFLALSTCAGAILPVGSGGKLRSGGRFSLAAIAGLAMIQTGPLARFFDLPIHPLLAVTLFFAAIAHYLRPGERAAIPAAPLIYPLNMALVTLVTYGSTRFVMVIAFLFPLLTFGTFLSLLFVQKKTRQCETSAPRRA